MSRISNTGDTGTGGSNKHPRCTHTTPVADDGCVVHSVLGVVSQRLRVQLYRLAALACRVRGSTRGGFTNPPARDSSHHRLCSAGGRAGTRRESRIRTKHLAASCPHTRARAQTHTHMPFSGNRNVCVLSKPMRVSCRNGLGLKDSQAIFPQAIFRRQKILSGNIYAGNILPVNIPADQISFSRYSRRQYFCSLIEHDPVGRGLPSCLTRNNTQRHPMRNRHTRA